MSILNLKRVQASILGARQATLRRDAPAAAQLWRTALPSCSNRPDLLAEAGQALLLAGDGAGAEPCFRRVLELQPGNARAWEGLGQACRARERHREAVECHRKAVALAPAEPRFHNALGCALLAAGAPEEAMEAFRRVVALAPLHPHGHANIGELLRLQLDRPGEAIPPYERCVELEPDRPEGWRRLAQGFMFIAEPGRAVAACRRALQLDPDHAVTRFDLAHALLLDGQWEEGWAEYEWRLRLPDRGDVPYPGPLWRGEPLQGRRIFIHAEQGLGDMLMACRYFPRLAEAGADLVLACPPELKTLMEGLPSVGKVLQEGDPVPPYDVHAPVMSLPGAFGAGPADVPPPGGYLAADPERVARWKRRLAPLEGLKVGLCWQGNPRHLLDRFRSLPLAALLPLLAQEGVSCVSLQKGPGEEQVRSLPGSTALLDLSGALPDGPDAFAELAAVVTNLDLVITVDTAVAHLAGALGRPAFVLLPYAPEWRWLVDRPDSPWYASLRLFRQTAPGDWPEVVGRVREALLEAAVRQGT
jgi:tetratricopeptide (TPR) repeat protein